MTKQQMQKTQQYIQELFNNSNILVQLGLPKEGQRSMMKENQTLIGTFNVYQNKDEIMKIFSTTYGSQNAKTWWQRWRIFFMSCAELFGMDRGSEWGVSHYLFIKRGES